MNRDKRPLYIFDLDGTLADIGHREGLLTDGVPNTWDRFFDACAGDAPVTSVIRTLEALRDGAADVWVFSGRSDRVRGETVAWLSGNTSLTASYLEAHLMMRPEGDYTPDQELKEQWLSSMLEEDRSRLVAVFDDRDKVVAMWRRHGVTCFQVAPGDF